MTLNKNQRNFCSKKVGMQQKCWKYNLQNAVDIQSYTLYELHFQWPFLYLEHLDDDDDTVLENLSKKSHLLFIMRETRT